MQGFKHLRVGFLQESSCKLVQQAPDVFGGCRENPRLLRQAARLGLCLHERAFQRACHVGQRMKTHGGGTARQRMGQTDR